MAKKQRKTVKQTRRTSTQEFKQQAVQMLLDGSSASSVSENLGIGNANLVYRWKAEQVAERGPPLHSSPLLRQNFALDELPAIKKVTSQPFLSRSCWTFASAAFATRTHWRISSIGSFGFSSSFD